VKSSASERPRRVPEHREYGLVVVDIDEELAASARLVGTIVKTKVEFVADVIAPVIGVESRVEARRALGLHDGIGWEIIERCHAVRSEAEVGRDLVGRLKA
jgi:hypothetical protein